MQVPELFNGEVSVFIVRFPSWITSWPESSLRYRMFTNTGVGRCKSSPGCVTRVTRTELNILENDSRP